MISAVGASTSGAQPSTKDKNGDLGKEDFLKLLVTQLKAQDPMNPQDGAEFVAQLAQFTSLERLVNIEEGVGNMTMATLGTNATMASTFIGKTVRIAGDQITFDGTSGEAHFTLEKDAKNVSVDVLNEKGEVIDTLNATDLKAGSNSLTWDGTYHDANGNELPARPGKYSFKVTAKDDQSADVTVRAEALETVDAVHFTGSGVPELILASGKKVALSDVTEVQAGPN